MNARRRIVAWLASLAMAIMLAPSIAGAEEMSYSALMSRIDALEEQLQQQHADFVAYEMGGAQKDDDGKGNGRGKGNGKGKGDDGCPSWYAGYEATVLRPYISSNNANALTPVPALGFDNNYGVGHRFILGRDNGNGVGVRMRYWVFNTGHDTVPPVATVNLDMDVLDLEATLSERLGNFDVLLSGGVRYGRVGFSLGIPEVYFEGTGPTVSIQATREVGNRGLYLVGNMRASLLIGEIRDPADLIGGSPVSAMADTVDDDLTTVLESQLGVGWSRETARGELHLRGLWETQFWMNDTFNDDVDGLGFNSNLGLSGVTIAAEFRR